ncbi:MAG: hypothetical protein KAQ62_22595, partial [Cyclobacteriaceae bacterium]|nr:hypothetical protein [Cyclobacteriaceae bacterium]
IPYPTHLSDFTDPDERVFILVTNYGTESHQIVLTGSLRNETSGITIATNPSNPPTNPIIIEPGITQLTGSDLSELFDPVHLSFSVGVTAETIRDDQALPDGFYTLCIRAFDAFNPGRALSSDPNITLAGCATFDVSKIDAPDIINPANDEPFDPSIPNIYISWNWNRPTFGGDDVSFTLRIVETDPEGRDPNWVLQTSTTPELFYQSGILETFYNLSFPDDVTLEQGQSYVIQVIAVDDMGELIFENGGRSMPVVFYYDNPMFAVGEPFWRTENEITFDFGAEMELSYEIPINDDDEDGANLNTNIYIFRIPSDQTPEQAFEAGDFVQHVEIYDPLTNADNPHYFMTDFESMTYGNTYGAKIQLFDAFDRDDYLLENGGESGILIFNYGAPVIIPQPEWITRSGVSFDDPSDISLAYQIRMEEGTGFEMQLDGSIFYFEIPDGTTPEMAAQETSGLHRIDIASGEIFNERSVEREVLPFAEDIEFGRRYGAFIEISDSRHMADAMYRFENNGRSEILTFTMGAVSSGTDIVLTYPLDGDRIPFSFFPLIARYEPFNTQYQHWKSECTLIKDGSPDDFFTGDGLRWPGGSQAGHSTLDGLSEITEDESQNVAVFKNNDQRSIPFERGANYRWETNVKLYDVVEPTAVDPFLEFDKNSNFSRGMGPSDLLQPDWGAIIAPDSTFNFSWITSDAPEQLLPHHRINHVTRQRLTYFNGVVKEKWVLEVARSEAMDSIIHHLDGNIGNGVIDYLSGEYSEERILAELYKELESSTSFTPTDTGYYYWRVKWLENPDAGWDTPYYESSQVRPFWVGNSPPPGTTSRTTPEEGCVSECLSPEITNTTNLSSLTPGSTVNAGKFQMNVIEVTGSAGARFTGTGEIRIPYLNNLRVSVSFENISINNAMELFSGKIVAINDVPSISMDTTGIMIGGQRVSVPSMSETEAEILDAAITSTERLVSMMTDDRAIGMPIGLDNEIDGVSYVIGITEMTFKPRKAQLTAVMRVDIPSVGKYIPALGAKDVCFTPGGLGDEGRLYLHRDWTMTPEDSDVQFSFSGVESGDTTRATYVEWDCQGYKCMAIRGNVEFSTDMIVKEGADGEIIEGENVRANFGVKTCRGGNWIAEIGIDAFQIKGADGWGFHSATAYLDFSDIENPPSM